MVRLTPQMLAAAYEFLRETEPFNEWNLPPAEELGFRVVKDKAHFGWFETEYKRPPFMRILVSERTVGHTDTLLKTIGHEMIHLFLHTTKQDREADHGPTFKAYAAKVCEAHGWDLGAF
jgi:hypothetical protein